ncbi:metal ABC transporter permease [Celerinatantimonas sp. YJH-8]|uniref:metal ABC transporter permease n=1 Tax=Celerinatantimonas sp. YJH-8 TaxID=3228714 RepID=UPI0038BE42F1
MIDLLFSPFSDFEFMRRALVGCTALSLSSAPVGVFLMLRRMSLTGDAMAHAILPGAAIGFLLAGLSIPAMTIGGLIAGALVAILSGAIARATNSGEDASMAAFYLISLALGVLIISQHGSNVDLLHVLFGSALALNDMALYLLAGIATISLILLAICYRPLVMECLDPAFLKSVSRLSTPTHLCFLVLVVLNLVAGFHALGTLMSVGLMILPATSARFWSDKLGWLLILAVLIDIFSCFTGLLTSFYFGWSTSPAIILVLGCIYVVSMLLGRRGGLLIKLIPRRHLTT